MKTLLLATILMIAAPTFVCAQIGALPMGPASFEFVNSGPTQFNVKDVTITSDGKCKVRNTIGPYANSPCEEIYGVKTSSNTTTPSMSNTVNE